MNEDKLLTVPVEPMFSDSRLILSAGTIPHASFRERVQAAGLAGFDAISLFPQQYLVARRNENLSIGNMREILAENDVAVDEVDPLLDWFSAEATPSESLMMEMADGLGARSINVAVAFVSDQPFEKIAESFSNVCERVARFGLRADIEFLPWTQIGDLTTALKLLDHANQVNAGVMFDFWHFFNGDEDLDVLRNLTPSQVARITSLQLNDAPQLIAKLSRRQNWRYTKGMFQNVADGIKVLGLKSFLNVAAKSKYPHPDAQEMMKNALCSRLFPGCGVMPVLEVLSILCKKGAQPTIGIEVFNLDSQEQSAALRSEMAMSSYTQLTKSQKA